MLAWGVYALAKVGPRNAEALPGAEIGVSLNAAQRELAGEVAAIERWLRETAPDQGASVRAAKLEQAIARQRQLVQMMRHPSREEAERLERLEAERDTAAVQPLRMRSVELERRAETERQAGRAEVANAGLREALQVQREINRSHAAARDKDFVRETRLALQLETAEATPWRERADAARARAETALQRQDWSEALAAKTEAHDTLAELNRRFPQSRLADLRMQDALAKEVVSLTAAALVAESEAQERAGDDAAGTGRSARAAELYQAAMDAQAEVNRRQAGSRFASTRRIEDLEVKRQTVLAREAWQEIVVADEAVQALLRQRQTANAATEITAATALLEKIETTWPKNQSMNATLKLKLTYLGRQRADLRTLQDELYEQLLPIPGAQDWLMLRTEVTQALYAKIMGSNPSRNVGRKLPVDSVDWTEAQVFCLRLTWLLGATVRLPTEDEFRHALGEEASAAVLVESRGALSREVGELPANAYGFFDLTSNVAEWLHADADTTPTASVVSGSYLDPVAREMTTVTMEKTTRARHIGFRVVLQLPRH